MAEPKQSAGGKPTLVALDSDRQQAPVVGKATPATAPGEERERPRLLVWWLVLGLLVATVTALVQTQRVQQASGRIAILSDQVIGLGAQLSAANTQVQTLEMQRGQVREAVADLSEQVLLLNELVAK